MAQVWQLPTDYGDQLGDPSLRETLLFDPFFALNYYRLCSYFPIYRGQSVSAFSVLYVRDRQLLSEIFEAQSESIRDSGAAAARTLPSHVMFDEESGIPSDWFQHLRTLSTLGICSPYAITSLSEFLNRQPPDSTLHHLAINTLRWGNDRDKHRSAFSALLQALNSPHCNIDGFMLTHAFPEESLLLAETLLQPATLDGNVGCKGCKFQCLGFMRCSLPEEAIEILAEMMLQCPDSKLSELSLFGSCNFVENSESLRHLATALQQGHCKLTRLDIRQCQIDGQGLKLLFESLQSSKMPIRDLGLTINGHDSEAVSILRDALESPDFCIQVLRFELTFETFNGNEIADFLGIVLGGPNCKVCVLDLELNYNDCSGVNEWQCLFQTLQQRHKVQCLRVFNKPMNPISEPISALAGFLRASRCSLLWLEWKCYNYHSPRIVFEEPDLAEALHNNYRICTLSFPWRDCAAEARASSFLKRNRLYRLGGLSEQEFVKPHTAKLFICGHPEVGKTTLRKRLLKASASPCNQCLDCGSLLHLCGSAGPARTRGMELHTLSFSPHRRTGGEQNQLVICDLAGQQEYHAFHHYFVSGSNKDLFLVVCKYHSAFSQQDLDFQLEYWFRFVVCHRSSGGTTTKPKVLVLLNFFVDVGGDMNQISRERSRRLLHKYREELDFGLPGEENVFGIVATDASQTIQVRNKLENLHGQLLENRATIPKICDDISSYILPKLLGKGRLCSMRYSSKTLFLPYSQLHNLCYKHFQTQPEAMPSAGTFQAALLELHNAGQIVYFQPDARLGADLQTDPLIITDCGWFCHDLIGSLLAPVEFGIRHFNLQRRPESWLWNEEDVKQMLRNQKCEEKYLDEILRYLQSLELCYHVTVTQSHTQLLFPALLRPSQEPVQNLADVFFQGRRLKCQDTAKQLLPSGLFARLQVKLNKFCGNSSYKVQYGLICFSKDFVRVEIRFGGDTGRWEDRQWIDILVFYADSSHSWTADDIMGRIKAIIHEMCQANERGCPTVLLQECILRDNVRGGTDLPLDAIHNKVLKMGINSSIEWEDGECVEAIKFLLPSEIKELATQHATQQFQAVANVQKEFGVSTDEKGIGSSSLQYSRELVEDVAGLDEAFQKLWQLIKQRLDKLDASISGSLQDIKNEIGTLADGLKQAEKHIISNCSTHLLTQLLESPLPLYPYLTDVGGKWQKLASLVAGKRMQLHFMCEEGPHEIRKQEGVAVVLKAAEWLARIAPVLVPALRVFCCAGRLAATVYLPGSQDVFAPTPGFLESLGLDDEALQRQILPEVLKALVEGIYCNVDQLSGEPLEESAVRGCLTDLLQGLDVNMRRDFSLRRVVMNGKGKHRISWVCAEHALGHRLLAEGNPFT